MSAQNPIVPPGLYIADPTARVWEDVKLYIYGSLEKSTDLQNWELFKNSFSSKGEGDKVPYSDALLFAPDCQVKVDSFHLAHRSL